MFNNAKYVLQWFDFKLEAETHNNTPKCLIEAPVPLFGTFFLAGYNNDVTVIPCQKKCLIEAPVPLLGT